MHKIALQSIRIDKNKFQMRCLNNTSFVEHLSLENHASAERQKIMSL